MIGKGLFQNFYSLFERISIENLRNLVKDGPTCSNFEL